MQYYIVDAFTSKVFKGNPAGVCILEQALPEEMMQQIAMENNLSETAFAYKEGEKYKLRWFTPTFEIDLCGHATLATAYIICNYVEQGRKSLAFDTVSGILTVERKENLYEMTLPNRKPDKIEVSQEITEALGFAPSEVYSSRDLIVMMEDEKQVKEYIPDYKKLLKLKKWLGVVITAKGTDSDFVSRYFCPELDAEDPVTGSSHSSLVPLWSEKCGKEQMVARQLSKREGILYCTNEKDKVIIAGEACLYLKGEIEV